MKKKIKISSVSEFPKKFIGISSHFKDIQVVWSLNNLTGFNFSKSDDFIKIILNPKKQLKFSLFEYTDEQNNKHFLIANKNKDAILFPKFNTIDYIYITNSAIENLSIFNSKLYKSKMIIGHFILHTDKIISSALNQLFEE